jgi:ribosome-interacting GTPase 1
MDSIRVFTKEPGKPRTEDPIVLSKNSTVKDVAEKILKGFSKKVKETRVTGPSSKFPNQKVGLSHILKDLDIVEFHTN